MERTGEQYDVVIVGAGLAGCTAATLYGRAGLRVALLEKHRSADTAKGLCGHFILAGTQPTLRRLGLRDRMLAAGAVEGDLRSHTGGWSGPTDPDLPVPISLRRTVLDPMVRDLAASTPGVDLLLGHTMTRLLDDGQRIIGVEARPPPATRSGSAHRWSSAPTGTGRGRQSSQACAWTQSATTGSG